MVPIGRYHKVIIAIRNELKKKIGFLVLINKIKELIQRNPKIIKIFPKENGSTPNLPNK